MERVIVTRAVLGIYTMQVCAVDDATDEEILRECNLSNPSGTRAGWTTVVRNDPAHPALEPVTCDEHVDRRHFVVTC